MALTTGRALALAVVGMATAMVLLLPPRPGRLTRSGTYVRNAALQARIELRGAMQAVAARMARDAARNHDAAGSPIVFLGPWDDSAQSWLRARAETQLGGRASDADQVRIAFARDSAFGLGPQVLFAIPTEPGEPCVAIHAERYHPSAGQRRTFRRLVSTGLLGPCAYYAEFGPPGAAVARWLRAGGTALTLAGPGQRTEAVVPARRSWVAALLTGNGAPVFADQRLPAPLALESCAAGRLEFCSQLVRGPRAGDRRLTALGIRQELLWATSNVEATWLSDLLGAHGPAAFAEFWTSGQDFEGAFDAAFGESVAAWTHGWIVRRLDRAAGGSLPVRAGLSLVSAALFLGVAVAIATRRRAS